MSSWNESDKKRKINSLAWSWRGLLSTGELLHAGLFPSVILILAVKAIENLIYGKRIPVNMA
jgi:hypothetical protein